MAVPKKKKGIEQDLEEMAGEEKRKCAIEESASKHPIRGRFRKALKRRRAVSQFNKLKLEIF